MQRFEVQVQLLCPKCQVSIETTIAVPEPDWANAESMSDLNSEGETEVECGNCGSVFSANVTNVSGSCEVILDEFPDVEVATDIAHFSPSEDDDWGDYDVPEDPYSIFLSSHAQVIDLLDTLGENDGAGLVNRMVFSQQVSALEAYLGDTLINGVFEGEKESLLRLVRGDPKLVKERFSLVEIVDDPNFVATKVRQYLRSVLYHNLGKVSALYKIALDIDLFSDEKESKELHKAIEHRHDCVHLNGFDKDGKKLEVFTKQYVREVGRLMERLVTRVETAIASF